MVNFSKIELEKALEIHDEIVEKLKEILQLHPKFQNCELKNWYIDENVNEKLIIVETIYYHNNEDNGINYKDMIIPLSYLWLPNEKIKTIIANDI